MFVLFGLELIPPRITSNVYDVSTGIFWFYPFAPTQSTEIFEYSHYLLLTNKSLYMLTNGSKTGETWIMELAMPTATVMKV